MDKIDTSSSSSKPAMAQSWDKTFYEKDEKRVTLIYELNPALDVTDKVRSKLKLLQHWHDSFEESLPNLKTMIERRFLDGEVFYHKYGMNPEDALHKVDPTRSFDEKVKMYDRIRLLNRKSKTDLLEGYPLFNDLVATVINESTSAFNTFSEIHEALKLKKRLYLNTDKFLMTFEKAAEALDHWHKLLKRGIFGSFAKFTLGFVSEQFSYFQNCQVLLGISSNNDVGTLDKQEKIAERSTAADLNRRSIKSAKLCELNSFKTSKQKFKKLEPKIRKLLGKPLSKEQRSASKAFGASGCSKKTNDTPTSVVSQKAKVVNGVKKKSKTETEAPETSEKLFVAKPPKNPKPKAETPKTDGKAPESVLSSTQSKTEETGKETSKGNSKNNNNNIITEPPKPNNDSEKAAARRNSDALNAPLGRQDSPESSKTAKFVNKVEEIPSPQQERADSTVSDKNDKKEGEILEMEKKEKEKEKDSEEKSDWKNGLVIWLFRSESKLEQNKSKNSNTRLQDSLKILMTLSSNAFETSGEVKSYAVDAARKFIGWLLNADIVPREENSDRRKSNSVQQKEREIVVKPE